MKKFIICAVFALFCSCAIAQDFTITNKVVKVEKTVSQDIDTGYQYDTGKNDENGKIITLPIYASKSGACYVIKTSKKSGKQYRHYLGKEVSAQIMSELKKSSK